MSFFFFLILKKVSVSTPWFICIVFQEMLTIKTIVDQIGNIFLFAQRRYIVHIFQVIRSCKRYITENGRTTIWNQERDVIEVKLTECVKLNDHYR